MARKSLAEAIALLEAGDWRGAHEIVRDDHAPLASWAHGIVHLIEGDQANARYWYGLARRAFPHAGAIDAEIAALKCCAGGGP